MKVLQQILFSGLVLLGVLQTAGAQTESLLDLLDEEETTDYITNAFKSSRVINGHSMEMLGEGVLDFRILHRFGKINQGWDQFFGLDQATMRIGFDYGVTPNLTLGIGRTTYLKELDGFVKYRIFRQSEGARNMPVSVVWVSGVTMNGLDNPTGNPDVEVKFSRRLAYYHELIIGRKFDEHFTLQLSPVLVHRNIVQSRLEANEFMALGIGARYKLTQRIALVVDYYHAFNRFPSSIRYNPLSIGFDIETGGHVFQLHFSNAQGMNERAFLTDNNGEWFNGDIQFGFNLSRVFQLKQRKPD